MSNRPLPPSWKGFSKAELKGILKNKYQEYEKLAQLRSQWLSSTPLWFWTICWESLLERDYMRLQRTLRRIDRLISPVSSPPAKGITDEHIEQARDYPVDNLLTVKKHWATCPAHNDKHPSLYVKNNWCYCFSCGWHADVIKLYQALNGCDFITAVKALSYAA